MARRALLFAPAFGWALAPRLARADPPADCGAPADLHDGWKIAAPAAEGLDPRQICAIGPHLEKLANADANGVVIVRHGVLVYEHYFAAKDRRWPELHWAEQPRTAPHEASTLHDLQSITKSVVALLVGIAFDRGWLKSLDAPVWSFFPEYADLRTPDKERIALRQLLSMTSGLVWPDNRLSLQRLDAAPNPYRFVLEKPVEAAPDTIWNYSNGGVEVIGAIVAKVSGQPIDRLAKAELFLPLGITDWEWGRLANGAPAASWGLRLRPRDLAKIGQLVLNDGVWQGRRIVSALWLRQMTQAHSPPGWLFGWGGRAYGYLWWLGRAALDDRNIAWVGGIGWGGQRLFVAPSMNLVVVVTAGAFARGSPQDIAGDTALHLALRAASAAPVRSSG